VFVVLVELGVVEQRLSAVLEVLNDGVSVTEVAARFGVTRQSVHRWLRRYADRGLAGLVDQSTAPGSCPHQMGPSIEARIVEMRVEHPGWGPRTIGFWLAKEGVDPVPGRSSIYRCLVRHRLITPEARKRSKGDYRRWERSRSMELWQMDIVGGVRLVDGSEAKIGRESMTTRGSVSPRRSCRGRRHDRRVKPWRWRCAVTGSPLRS
jgi:transposase